jgi:hypothetical protein
MRATREGSMNKPAMDSLVERGGLWLPSQVVMKVDAVKSALDW